jgi:bacterioferritin (cytochrome b1)
MTHPVSHETIAAPSLRARPSEKPRLCLRSSEEWLTYFRRNTETLVPIPWSNGVSLTPTEKQTIYRSIQQFQRGENSEGNHLRRFAHAYAARTGDVAYSEAMDLFIQEEQRHARDLGRFMDLADIPRTTSHWSDRVFRRLRTMGNLETMLSVLLAAELIAKAYYVALRDATDSPALRQLCRQILRDEEQHVHFHVERLARLRAGRRWWSLDLVHALYRLFFGSTCLVVWMGHARVFRKTGTTFRVFWTTCQQHMREAMCLMDPRICPGKTS